MFAKLLNRLDNGLNYVNNEVLKSRGILDIIGRFLVTKVDTPSESHIAFDKFYKAHPHFVAGTVIAAYVLFYLVSMTVTLFLSAFPLFLFFMIIAAVVPMGFASVLQHYKTIERNEKIYEYQYGNKNV